MSHIDEKGALPFTPREPESPKKLRPTDEKTASVAKISLSPKPTETSEARPILSVFMDDTEEEPTPLSTVEFKPTPKITRTIKTLVSTIVSLHVGILSREELREELKAIFKEAEGEKFSEIPDGESMPFFRNSYRKSKGIDIPRSFFLEKHEGKTYATIALNRQNIWRGSSLTGDGYPFPIKGAFKNLKWGIRFQLGRPSSAKRVIISSEKASFATEREASLLTSLSKNPSIIHLHLASTHPSTKIYSPKKTLIFDYYTHGNFEEGLAKGLPIKQKWDALKQIAQGLASIHETHIAHRDIKPANIFGVREFGEMKWRIGDFGSAIDTTKATPEELTRFSATKSFMAPETAKARTTGTLTSSGTEYDVWSFGILAFYTLTGHYPAWCCNEKGALLPDDRLIEKIASLNQESVDASLETLPNEKSKRFLKQILKIDPEKRPSMEAVMGFF